MSVLVLACLDADLDISTGTCAAPFWTVHEQAGYWSGATPETVGPIIAALLTLAAVAYIIRTVIKQAEAL